MRCNICNNQFPSLHDDILVNYKPTCGQCRNATIKRELKNIRTELADKDKEIERLRVLLVEADEELAFSEDIEHGEDGDNITRLRVRIQAALERGE